MNAWVQFRSSASRLLVVTGILLVTGCASLFPPAKPQEVNDSQLNWLIIRYKPLAVAQAPCRIEVVGAGFLSFDQGQSPLVADSFSIDTEHAQWSNRTQERLGMTPAEARRLLQQFVDAGLLTEPMRLRKTNPDAPGIAVFRWSINNKRGTCISENPELITLIDALIAHITRQGI